MIPKPVLPLMTEISRIILDTFYLALKRRLIFVNSQKKSQKPIERCHTLPYASNNPTALEVLMINSQ